MIEMMKESLKELLADQEYFGLAAKVLKRMHGALLKAGFTEEQATTIVAGQGIGTK